MGFPVLSVLTFAPAVAAVILMCLRAGSEKQMRLATYLAFAVSLAVLLVSVWMIGSFDPANTSFQFVEKAAWMPSFDISYHKGVDGISIWFVVMAALLTPICMLSVLGAVKNRVREFLAALLLLETMMIGMFSSLDAVLFYLFFEGVLIPMFLMIGIWGGPKRIYAAYKFFLYTFVGSVLMLVALIVMYHHTGTSDMTVMMQKGFPAGMQAWLWLAFFISFAVKSPMWPFHTWLPYAHVEAPTAGSVILAGVLLKMGGYGLLRINIQMLPVASFNYADVVLVLSLIAIIYTSLVAFVQTDMKKLIAYSSVAHMGYVTLGLFTFNQQGIDGAMMVMLSHTVVSSALFLCVGVVYDRLHTREIARYGGMATNMPYYALFFMLFTLASVGLPGTSGFIGEFLSMQGAFAVNGYVAAVAGLGIILGAAYMLRLYRALFYGPLEKPDVQAMPDLNRREWLMFVPLAVLVLWMGVAPAAFKDVFSPLVAKIVEDVRVANVVPVYPTNGFELQPPEFVP
ncbi:MAG: NADH-quinone oxidoreductase subunit M [Bdellovibrionales bacterium]